MMKPEGEARIDLGSGTTSAYAPGRCRSRAPSAARHARGCYVQMWSTSSTSLSRFGPSWSRGATTVDRSFSTPDRSSRSYPPSTLTTTTPITRTMEEWPGCWSSCGPGHELDLRTADPPHARSPLRRGHGRLPSFRRAATVPEPRMRRHRDPTGHRGQGAPTRLRRARGDTRDRRPNRPRRPVRRRLHEPRPRACRPAAHDAGASPRSAATATDTSSANCRPYRRGRTPSSGATGAVTTTPGICRFRRKRV